MSLVCPIYFMLCIQYLPHAVSYLPHAEHIYLILCHIYLMLSIFTSCCAYLPHPVPYLPHAQSSWEHCPHFSSTSGEDRPPWWSWITWKRMIIFFFSSSIVWRRRFSASRNLHYFLATSFTSNPWMVTHPGANHHDPSCLNSVFLQELVFPTWYSRSFKHLYNSCV